MKYTFITFLLYHQSLFPNGKKQLIGNRTLDTLQQEIQKFDEIDVLGPFKITLKKGDHHNVTIVGESNLIPHVEMDVNKSKLVLRTSNNKRLHSKTQEAIQIAVTAVEISNIYVIGSGEVSSSTSLFSNNLLLELIGSGEVQFPVESQRVAVHITGAGRVQLKGSCKTIKGKITGSGHLQLNELQSKNSFLYLTGSGRAQINCTDKLIAVVDRTADVVYTGEPEIVDVSTWLGRGKYKFSDRRLAVETNE